MTADELREKLMTTVFIAEDEADAAIRVCMEAVKKEISDTAMYSCQNDICREEISYPANMLAIAPNGKPVCEECWCEDCMPYGGELGEDGWQSWSDLPGFDPLKNLIPESAK